jgi:hypothetical protein
MSVKLNASITANVYAECTRLNPAKVCDITVRGDHDKKAKPDVLFDVHTPKLTREQVESFLARNHESRECKHVSLEQYGKVVDELARLRAEYKEYRKQHPDQPEPTNGCRGLGDILDDPNLTTDQMCVHVVEVIIHERPETCDEIRAHIPNNEIPGQVPNGGPPPNTEISRGIFSAFGGIAQLVGGFLQSPLAVPLLTAACAAIPGLQPLAPFIPVIAPIAGAALGGLGGMSAQVGEGQAPSLDASSLASPDLLASVLPALTGLAGA